MISLEKYSSEKGIYIVNSVDREFENLYLKVREREQRIYSDPEVANLPSVSVSNQHFKEWELRKTTSDRFSSYLSQYKNALNILDVGCGNGWFSSQIAKLSSWNVFALDINKTELEQAARVFNQVNLKFILGNIFENIFENNSYDIITLNASIQYFNNLDELLEILLPLLIDSGEVHILDSPFYKKEELAGARKRTAAYYASLGFLEMAEFYFHHTYDDLKIYNHTILFNPHSGISKIKKLINGKESPFPWIKIAKF